MRKLPLLLIIPIFLFYPKATLAAYSSASVHVNGTHTSIRIESNGQVKTYDSDNSGSVSIQSSDGTADSPTPTPSPLLTFQRQSPLDQFKAFLKRLFVRLTGNPDHRSKFSNEVK